MSENASPNESTHSPDEQGLTDADRLQGGLRRDVRPDWMQAGIWTLTVAGGANVLDAFTKRAGEPLMWLSLTAGVLFLALAFFLHRRKTRQRKG